MIWRKPELRGQHTNDGVGDIVECDRSTDHTGIGPEHPPPQTFTQKDNVVVADDGIFGSEAAPQFGLESEEIDKTQRDAAYTYRLRTIRRGKNRQSLGVRLDPFEDLPLRAPVC